jgi:hypothetical protein
VFGYAMKAFGLDDMAFAKAFMRKLLTEGIDRRDSFANGLADKRYREFAEAFNLARYGETTTVFERTRQGTVDRYLRQTLEEDAGRQNEGSRLALYFERKAQDIASPYHVLADRALLQVVQTALRLPPQTSALDIDAQAEIIERRLDLEELKDPDKLRSFLNRFATLWEIDHPSAPPAVPGLLFAQPLETGIGNSLLASLQNLKLGGR